MTEEKRVLTVIGSTGSVGVQTLEVARHLGYRVAAIAANSNIELLEKQAREFRPAVVCAACPEKAAKLRENLKDLPVKVVAGEDGLCQAAVVPEADCMVAAAVGFAGLKPVLEAIDAGKDIALANKETLVAAGSIVMPAAKKKKVRILPVDSEHSAVFQALQGSRPGELNRILLTCSGGPFFWKTPEELEQVTLRDALRHPNWSMGGKITVDCATLMNKGLEVMEAMWLFDQPAEKIEILIHRESIVHSLVEFTDRSVLAQLGVPDMRLAIQYALTYPRRLPGMVEPLDLTKLSGLTFRRPDPETFVCLKACLKAARRGGTLPAAINAANEAAVALFFAEKIRFCEIGQLVSEALDACQVKDQPSLEEIFQADRWGRDFVSQAAGQ